VGGWVLGCQRMEVALPLGLLMSDSSEKPFWQAPPLQAGLFAASITSVVSVFLYGAIHKFTNHRPLGAATLAVLVLFMFFALFILSARFRVKSLPARISVLVAVLVLGALGIAT
jgi:hypothetical protein